ncbi:succinate dehydrogenase cytochrome b subunit [Flavobacterium sp. '19STA2R22 D10 B1']|uniref:succinate dehydrogenase cytochrome b subunit n=1 Tax=Flavobacterium aerium TaxID=3037261 RepID=UPI00278C8191|nr:succinate dehydrogenase cytochrome b subunit [Flavobacterium sp. '19STA2R22 D10 B1']
MQNTTLTKKIIMALTGLFLCFFLIIHFLGNMQLFIPGEKGQEQFNYYSDLLSGNIVIKIISYVLYLSLIGHALYALIITLRNTKSGGSFKKDKRGRASKWYSRNMGILGTILLIFLVIHFKDFWYVYKFGTVPLDQWGKKDLYTVVINAYNNIGYVILYVVCMIALGYHLLHGFYSACRTLGVYHPKYVRWLKYFGTVYSIGISLGFAIIPIYIFITKN